MFELFVSENKSFDPVRFCRNRVRVFLDKNYAYGLWIDEDKLFDLLSVDQKKQYLTDRTPSGRYYELSPEVAQQVLNTGKTPFSKQTLSTQNLKPTK